MPEISTNPLTALNYSSSFGHRLPSSDVAALQPLVMSRDDNFTRHLDLAAGSVNKNILLCINVDDRSLFDLTIRIGISRVPTVILAYIYRLTSTKYRHLL